MTETKLHYKLYKTKHGWVTATIAATALAIPVIGGSVTNHASADTTATTGTQTVTSGSNAVTATTASTTSVTPSNQAVTPDSSKLDQAVQNAKATANVTVNQTPTQTVTGSTVAEAKQKAEQDYQNQATQINQKVANQKANNDATNAANSFNIDNSKKRELDQAVQNAKATANVSVKQTQTQIYNTGVSGVENTKNKINNDYSTQINNINQAVSTQKAKNDAYNKAVAEANTLNSTADTTRKKLDDAIKAAQAVKGVTVIDGGTTTATVSVSDFEAKKKQIQDQNTQQANSINAQIQQYNQKLSEYQKNLNSDQINPDLILQHLQLGQEVNAKFSWKPLTNNGVTFINNGATHDSGYTPQNFKMIVNNSISGNVVQITYDNLQHSSYGDQKITKIIAIVHDVVKKAQTGNVDFWNNPFNGFWYEEISDITIDYHFYLANGQEVNFDPKLSDAWITAGSLNSGGGRTEAVKLESAGKAYGFYKSSVTAHNGNELYADGSNERNTTESAFGKGIIVPIPQGEWWDNPATGLRSKNAYYGAGVFKVEGKGVSLHYKVYGKPNQWESIWANLDTTMPKSNSGIVTPTIHYHHTNVALGLEINLIS